MSTKKTLSMLLGLLALTAIVFLVFSNSVVPTQGVQAESVDLAVVAPNSEWITVGPATHNVVTYSGSSDVAESLCNDPLLGPSAIIHTRCGSATIEKQHEDRNNHPVITTTAHPTVIPPTQDTPTTPPSTIIDNSKKHCNKGSGNGGEGCDPGNHPEKGNNDEGGDRHPANSKGGKEG